MLRVRRTGDAEYGRYIKALIGGQPGTGKTKFASTWPNVLYLNADGGLMSVADQNVLAIDIEDSQTLLESIVALRQDPPIREKIFGSLVDTVCLDTLDEVARILQRERLTETRKEAMQRDDWGWFGDQLRGIIRGLRNTDCLEAGTIVQTLDGPMPIEKLVGERTMVLSMGNEYRRASFLEFDPRPLWRVTFNDGQVFHTSAGHRWFLQSQRKQRSFAEKTTVNLSTHDRVPRVLAPKPPKNDDFRRGVAHGIVFGDGSRYGNANGTDVKLFGPKRELTPWVAAFGNEPREHDLYTYVSGLQDHWKDLPLSTSRSYWYGFTLGLLATDGNVGQTSVTISQRDRTPLDAINERCNWMGFHSYGVHEYEADTTTGKMCKLTLTRFSLEDNDFLRTDQRLAMQPVKRPSMSTRVKSIEPTGRVEPVYCGVEPETSSFVIGSGVLTGNCHVLISVHLRTQEDGENSSILVSPAIQGAVGDELAGYVDLALLMKANPMTKMVNGEMVRVTARTLQSYSNARHPWVKDRSGKLPPEFEVNFKDDFKRLDALIFGGREVDRTTPTPEVKPSPAAAVFTVPAPVIETPPPVVKAPPPVVPAPAPPVVVEPEKPAETPVAPKRGRPKKATTTPPVEPSVEPEAKAAPPGVDAETGEITEPRPGDPLPTPEPMPTPEPLALDPDEPYGVDDPEATPTEGLLADPHEPLPGQPEPIHATDVPAAALTVVPEPVEAPKDKMGFPTDDGPPWTCADCGGQFEDPDQAQLSKIRFRRRLCGKCFRNAKSAKR